MGVAIQLAAGIIEIQPLGLLWLEGYSARRGSGWKAGSSGRLMTKRPRQFPMEAPLGDCGLGQNTGAVFFFHLGYLLPEGQAGRQAGRWTSCPYNCPYGGECAGYRVGCFQTSSRNGTPDEQTKLLPEADRTRQVTGCTHARARVALQPPFEFGMMGC